MKKNIYVQLKHFALPQKRIQHCKSAIYRERERKRESTLCKYNTNIVLNQTEKNREKVYSSLNHGEGNGTPLQYSCLENPMDGGAWQAAVHGVAKRRTRRSNFTFTFYFHALEEERATHSSILAQRIPGTEEPNRLLSMGSHRVGHD